MTRVPFIFSVFLHELFVMSAPSEFLTANFFFVDLQVCSGVLGKCNILHKMCFCLVTENKDLCCVCGNGKCIEINIFHLKCKKHELFDKKSK